MRVAHDIGKIIEVFYVVLDVEKDLLSAKHVRQLLLHHPANNDVIQPLTVKYLYIELKQGKIYKRLSYPSLQSKKISLIKSISFNEIAQIIASGHLSNFL